MHKNRLPNYHHRQHGSLSLSLLSLYVNCNPGLKFHGEFILEDCYLGDEPFYQCLVKCGDLGGLGE